MPSLAISRVAPRAVASPHSAWSGGMRRRLSTPTVFLFVILTAQLMVVLDTTIVNVALPHIQAGLGLSGSGLSWVLNAYLLTFGGLLLLGARSGDLLGRRRTFLMGIAIFSLSSLMGGFAVAGWMLLGRPGPPRGGGALAAPSSLALLTTVFSDGPQRVRAIGLFTTVSAAGGAIGLVAGGALTATGVLAVGDVRQRSHRACRLGRRAHRACKRRPAPRPVRHRRGPDLDARHGRHRARAGGGGHRRVGRARSPWVPCRRRPPARRASSTSRSEPKSRSCPCASSPAGHGLLRMSPVGSSTPGCTGCSSSSDSSSRTWRGTRRCGPVSASSPFRHRCSCRLSWRARS